LGKTIPSYRMALESEIKKYLELLLAAGANILSPFDYTAEKLSDLVLRNQRQVALH